MANGRVHRDIKDSLSSTMSTTADPGFVRLSKSMRMNRRKVNGHCHQPTVNILGLNIIHDPTSHNARRMIWLASFVTCLLLAVVYGVGLIHRYRTYPTRVQLDVSNRQGIPLPAVTVCPLDRFDINRLEQLWRQNKMERTHPRADQRPLNSTEKYYQLAGVVPLDELWRNLAYPNAKSIFPTCYVGRGTDCHSVGHFQPVWTPSGTCFTYSSEVNTLSGQFNGLYLRLKISHTLDEWNNASGWKITLHEAGVSPWLVSSRQYMEMTTSYHHATTSQNHLQNSNSSALIGSIKSQFMYTRLTPKEFLRVDHPRQPCQTDNDAWSRSDCEIDCLTRAVITVTRCRLPYMNSVHQIPYCNTSQDVRRTEELVGQLITESRSQLKCRCIEPCNKVVYMYKSESHTVEIDYARIKIFYDTSLWVTVREAFVYSWVKLLCDAGNILCLLLGASLLSLVEMADYLFGKLIDLCLLSTNSRL